MRGKRGQSFLREMLVALDALFEPRLSAGFGRSNDGGTCALGVVGQMRGMDLDGFDDSVLEDRQGVADAFGIADALTAEIMYLNDEGTFRVETPEQRFTRMRAWVEAGIND